MTKHTSPGGVDRALGVSHPGIPKYVKLVPSLGRLHLPSFLP